MQTKNFNKATWLKAALCTSVLLLSLCVNDVFGGTYTYDFHSLTTSSKTMDYWYTDAACTSHVGYYYSATVNKQTVHYNYLSQGEEYTMYYKDNSIPSTAFTFIASSGNKAYFMSNNTCFLMGKNGAWMTLPTYSGEKITKVTITTSSGVSTSARFSIFDSSDNEATSDAPTSMAVSTAYELNISSTYQTSALKLKLTAAYNFQFTQIVITTETVSSKTDLSLSLDYTSTSLTACGSDSSNPTLTGNSGNGTVTWQTSDENVATVSSSGVVTPVAEGNARITANVAETTNYNSGSVYKDFTISAASARTVTWYVEGSSSSTSSVVPGNQATPPTPDPTSSCSGTFVGWVASGDAVIGDKPSDANTTAPSTIYTTSNKPTITCDGPVDFYAVFKKQ